MSSIKTILILSIIAIGNSLPKNAPLKEAKPIFPLRNSSLENGSQLGDSRYIDLEPHSRPYMAYVLGWLLGEYRFLSSAIIIDEYHVITTVFPHYGFGSLLRVIAGDHLLEFNDGTEQTRFVNHSFIHPDWNENESTNNDIAIIRVTQPFVFGDHVQPIAGIASDPIEEGSFCHLYGWAIRPDAKDLVYDGLKEVEMTVISKDYCTNYDPNAPIRDGHFCADTVNDAMCIYDYGSPLVCENAAGENLLVGTYNFGDCFWLDLPFHVFIDAPYYRDWLGTIIDLKN